MLALSAVSLDSPSLSSAAFLASSGLTSLSADSLDSLSLSSAACAAFPASPAAFPACSPSTPLLGKGGGFSANVQVGIR